MPDLIHLAQCPRRIEVSWGLRTGFYVIAWICHLLFICSSSGLTLSILLNNNSTCRKPDWFCYSFERFSSPADSVLSGSVTMYTALIETAKGWSLDYRMGLVSQRSVSRVFHPGSRPFRLMNEIKNIPAERPVYLFVSFPWLCLQCCAHIIHLLSVFYCLCVEKTAFHSLF